MHKSIHYHLHCFRLIRRSTPPIAFTSTSYILPLFDYCNNLLFYLPYKLIKLQRLQKSELRCVHLLPRHSSDSITPLLKQLYWLPVSYRIKYKLSLTIHKYIHHNSPDTLPPFSIYTHPLPQFTPNPPTPFSLLHPTYLTSTPPIYPFSPYHWNSLPYDLRTMASTSSFKRHLKTYFFSHAFPPTQ